MSAPDYKGCAFRPYADQPGHCDRCGAELTGRQKRWCSGECANADLTEHYWTVARDTAKKRDGRACVTCGNRTGSPSRRNPGKGVGLEVNHIKPRRGRGYGTGCWNHQDNLETLCTDCHVEVTNGQRAEPRRPLPAPPLPPPPPPPPQREALFEVSR